MEPQGAVATATAPVAVMAPAEVDVKPDTTPALMRILRGDHQALYAITATLAGQEADERRAWETAIRSMTGAIVDRAIGEGWLDFPTGNPFWDTFTVTQCRAIAGALAAAGHRFDGIDGWTDGRIPNYRDLTIAVADAALEPRRIRAWPTQEEIDDLYIEVTTAPDEFLATNAPEPRARGGTGPGRARRPGACPAVGRLGSRPAESSSRRFLRRATASDHAIRAPGLVAAELGAPDAPCPASLSADVGPSPVGRPRSR